MRQWRKVISDEESGMTLEQLLKAEGFTKKQISRLKFKTGGLTVDGEQRRSNTILRIGQSVAVNLGDGETETEHVNAGICTAVPKIFYEDPDLLIVEKPSGLSCHPGRGHYADNLGTQIQNYCRAKGERGEIRLIGRLDKDTSGGIVFAKNQTAASRLWKQREDGRFKKIYQVLVHGKLAESEGRIEMPLAPVPEVKNRMHTAKSGMHAVTNYRVKETFKDGNAVISLVECMLETGRTHQIRVHMASIGHPVLGDRFYGRSDDADRLCLHAGVIVLEQPFSGEKIKVEIPVKLHKLMPD